jgi:hypothetical protein
MVMNRATAKNGDEAIALAAKAVASSDRNLKSAAEYLAFAEKEGKTQREMAEGIGKSAAWVNGLLRWHREGYLEETPFGAQSQERDKRHDEQIREQEREQRSGPKHTSHSERKRKRSSRERTERELHVRGVSKAHRDTLVRVLGMLGSSHDNEALAAARKAEAMRARLSLTWDDLIVTPAEEQRRAA